MNKTNQNTFNIMFDRSDNMNSFSRFDDENKNNNEVRHSDVEANFYLEFPLFSDLVIYHPNETTEELLFHIKSNFDNPNWLIRFKAVNELRSLYKSLPENLEQILQCFLDYLMKSLFDQKVSIVKIALIALSDMVEYANKFPINFIYISKFLNALIAKCISGKTILKPILEKCLFNLLKNCLSEELIQQLCELSTNQNQKVSQMGFIYLTEALNSRAYF